MGQQLSGMDTHGEMSPTMLRDDTNMVIFENIGHEGEYGEYGVPAPMVAAPAPPGRLADRAADAAVAPPPAPADPAPIPTGTILARVYGTDEDDPMVDAEVHAHVQDVQLEGEVLVMNTSTIISMTTAVVLSAAAAPACDASVALPRDAVVAPTHDLVLVPPAGATPMELSMSTQEIFASGGLLAQGAALATKADKSEEICRNPDDELGVKARLEETGHQEAVVTNPALSITTNQVLDAVDRTVDQLEVNVTAQDVNIMLQIGAPAGVDKTNTATCAPFVVPQQKTGDVPPNAEFTVSIPSKMVASALETISHPKRAREEKDREKVEVMSAGVKHGSPDQRRRHLAEKKDPSESFNDGSSYSGSSSLKQNG